MPWDPNPWKKSLSSCQDLVDGMRENVMMWYCDDMVMKGLPGIWGIPRMRVSGFRPCPLTSGTWMPGIIFTSSHKWLLQFAPRPLKLTFSFRKPFPGILKIILLVLRVLPSAFSKAGCVIIKALLFVDCLRGGVWIWPFWIHMFSCWFNSGVSQKTSLSKSRRTPLRKHPDFLNEI